MEDCHVVMYVLYALYWEYIQDESFIGSFPLGKSLSNDTPSTIQRRFNVSLTISFMVTLWNVFMWEF